MSEVDLMEVDTYYVHPAMIVNSVLMTVFDLVSLVGNVLIIFLVSTRPRLRSITDMYIVNRAIAEIMYIIVFPTYVVALYKGYYIFGPVYCVISSVLLHVSLCVSHAFLVFLTIDCYLSGRKQHHTDAYRWKMLKVSTGVIWAASGLVIILVYFTTEYAEHNNNAYCIEGPLYATQDFLGLPFLFILILPLIFIWVYVCFSFASNLKEATIVNNDKDSEHETGTSDDGHVEQSRGNRIDYQVYRRLVLGLSIAFTVCFVPYWIIHEIHLYLPIYVYYAVVTFPDIYFAVGVILIFWLHKIFQQEFKNLRGRPSRMVPLETL